MSSDAEMNLHFYHISEKLDCQDSDRQQNQCFVNRIVLYKKVSIEMSMGEMTTVVTKNYACAKRDKLLLVALLRLHGLSGL